MQPIMLVFLLSGSAYCARGIIDSHGMWLLSIAMLTSMSALLYYSKNNPERLIGKQAFDDFSRNKSQEAAYRSFRKYFIVLAFLVASTYIMIALLLGVLNAVFPGCEPNCS